jgi:hypothetical protein
MLKKCYGLVLGLMVLTGSACVTPTHASSASIIISNIRAGGQVSAAEEGVVLYNNASSEVDISNWCLTNKAQVKFACITPPNQERIFLPGNSYAVIVSTAARLNLEPYFYTSVYEPSNHSSGAIVASSDTISLLDGDSQIVDQYSWTSSISSSQQWARMKLSAIPDYYLDTNTASDWQKSIYSLFPVSSVEFREVEQVPEDPDEPETPVDPVEPAESSSTLLPAIITELLPNALGSDTGSEFIEIFNPNKENDISLAGYTLAIGPSFEKVVTLGDSLLKPGEYRTFTNAELGYSLLNSSSRVRLIAKGAVTSETPMYSLPKEGEAWAFIGEGWEYTNHPTPGAANRASDSTNDDTSNNTGASASKPCAANQYRNLETNRCRLVSSATSTTQAPCKVGQERNLETNRCRNITNNVATACKEGQERNAETNRCRNIKQLSAVGFGVKGAKTEQSGMGWYIWAAIASVVLLVLGYATWEWRSELKNLAKMVKAKFARKSN